MKFKTLVCAGLLFVGGAANAVQLVVTVNDAQETRVRVAVGKFIGKGAPATKADVETLLAKYLRGVVQQVELSEARQAVATPAEPDVQ